MAFRAFCWCLRPALLGLCLHEQYNMLTRRPECRTFTRDDAWGVLSESFSQRAPFGACYVILSISKPLYAMHCDIGKLGVSLNYMHHPQLPNFMMSS